MNNSTFNRLLLLLLLLSAGCYYILYMMDDKGVFAKKAQNIVVAPVVKMDSYEPAANNVGVDLITRSHQLSVPAVSQHRSPLAMEGKLTIATRSHATARSVAGGTVRAVENATAPALAMHRSAATPALAAPLQRQTRRIVSPIVPSTTDNTVVQRRVYHYGNQTDGNGNYWDEDELEWLPIPGGEDLVIGDTMQGADGNLLYWNGFEWVPNDIAEPDLPLGDVPLLLLIACLAGYGIVKRKYLLGF